MHVWKSTELEPEPIIRPDRPLGVIILSILNGITAGLFPILQTSMIIISSNSDERLNILQCMTFILSAGIIFSSIGTWRGHDGSRITMIILITVYFSLQMFNETITISQFELSIDNFLGLCGRTLRYVAYIGVNAWYFLRQKTILFYRYPLTKK